MYIMNEREISPLERLINVVIHDDLDAYKTLDVGNKTLNNMVAWYEDEMTGNFFGERVLNDSLNIRVPGYKSCFVQHIILVNRYVQKYLPLNLILIVNLGALKILDYEMRKLFKNSSNNATLSPSKMKIVTGLLQETEAIPLNYHLKRNQNELGQRKQKDVLNVIMKHVSGYVILRAVEIMTRAPLPQTLDFIIQNGTWNRSSPSTYNEFINQLTVAYIHQIGSKRRGYTYKMIEDTITKLSQLNRTKNFSIVKKTISNAYRRDARRASARFALTRKRLPANAIQKILYRANLSNVNADTPGSSVARARNLARNKPHVQKVLDGISRKRKRMNFWN